MFQNLEDVFQDIHAEVGKRIHKIKNENLTITNELPEAIIGGTKIVKFYALGDGICQAAIKHKMHGFNVLLDFEIESPDAVFDAYVKSYDNSGGEWKNIKNGQHQRCLLKTKTVGETLINFYIHSSVPNCTCSIKFAYEV